MSENDLKVINVFTEVKYDNNSTPIKEREKFIGEFIDKFEEYNFKEEGIVFIDNTRQIKLAILVNRVIIGFEKESTLEKFTDYINELLNKIKTILKIDSFNRVGIRGNYPLKEFSSREETNEFMRNNFYDLPESKIDFPIDNINFSFNTQINNSFANININHLQKSNIEIHTGEKQPKEESNYFLNVDCDIYRKNAKFNEIEDIVSDLKELLNKHIKGIL